MPSDYINQNSARLRAWSRRQFVKSTWVDWGVLCTATAFSLWLWQTHQFPGWAIGVLAVVAAIMTFSRPTPLQRAIVIGLACGLFYLETRAISYDHEAQKLSSAQFLKDIDAEDRQKTDAILADNRAKTKDIIANAQRQFSATERRFFNIAKMSEKELGLSRKNLLNVTGGTAFAYVVPQNFRQNSIPLVVWNAGKYTLTGVSVRIDRETVFPFTGTQEALGTIPPHGHRVLLTLINPTMQGVSANPDSKNYFDVYEISITAQNGMVTEEIEFRPSNDGGWAQRYWVRRQDCTIRGRPIPKCLLAGPSFKYPEDVSRGEWSDGKEIN